MSQSFTLQPFLKCIKTKNTVNGISDVGLFPLNMHTVLKTDKLQASKLFSTPETSADSSRPEETTPITLQCKPKPQ